MNAVPSTAPQNTVTWTNSLVCLVYLCYKSPWFQLCKQLSFYCTGQRKEKYLSKLQSLNYLALLNACHNHKALQVFAMGTQIKQGHSQTKPEPITEWPKNTFNHLHHCNSFTHAKSSWHVNIAFSQSMNYFFLCTTSHDVGWVPILHASNKHKYIRAVLNEDYVAEVVQGPSILSRQKCSCVRITDMYTSLTLSPSPYN
jgi:hypothetical protein